MANCKNIITARALKIMLYGDSGTGKTSFAGSFPKPFFFDFDGGMLTLRGQDVEYESFPATDPKSAIAYEAMANKVLLRSDIETIVFDSLSTLSIMYQERLLVLSNKEEMDLKEYSRLIRRFEKFFSTVTSPALGKNIVCICHENRILGNEGNVQKIEPLIVGSKLAPKSPLWFDEVYYMTARNPIQQGARLIPGTREITAKPSRMHIAKSRLIQDGFVMENPTYEKLKKLIADEDAKRK